jgi:hypothetical protein
MDMPWSLGSSVFLCVLCASKVKFPYWTIPFIQIEIPRLNHEFPAHSTLWFFSYYAYQLLAIRYVLFFQGVCRRQAAPVFSATIKYVIQSSLEHFEIANPEVLTRVDISRVEENFSSFANTATALVNCLKGAKGEASTMRSFPFGERTRFISASAASGFGKLLGVPHRQLLPYSLSKVR